jgi:hypothetical protein
MTVYDFPDDEQAKALLGISKNGGIIIEKENVTYKFYENKKLWEKTTCTSKGKKFSGQIETYSKGGKLISQESWKNGEMEGPSIQWWATSGKVASYFNYHNGAPVGEMLSIDSKGKISRRFITPEKPSLFIGIIKARKQYPQGPFIPQPFLKKNGIIK